MTIWAAIWGPIWGPIWGESGEGHNNPPGMGKVRVTRHYPMRY